jgi:S-adenosylmethionine:tRNA ribosyltransferase-isomerase
MKLSHFKYNLPKTAIAKYPVSPRDKAKLMVLNRETQEIETKKFSNVVDYMNKGDVLVVNETRVFQARLFGYKEKTNAKIEVFLLRELNAEECIWDVIVDPARKVRIGNKIYFNDKLWCEVIDNTTSRGRTARFNQPGNVFKAVEKIGHTPLPPYIKRDPEPSDREDYQTIFAKVDGAVAAPTAGLHFTKALLSKIQKKGVVVVPIILHIGLGTFRPVEVEDSGWTDKFIYPHYDFNITTKLITNFHQTESTLLMLVSALAETDFILKSYKKALKEKYRFLSYGDAMLIL